jgi:hypothetical protein
MAVQYSKTTPHRLPFWFKPVSTFGLLKITTFIGSSHTLVVPAHPLLLSAFVLADSALPRGSAYRISGGYVVPRASHRAVTGSACLGRERLMEQPVSSGNTSSCETETHATFRSHEHMLGEIQADAVSWSAAPPDASWLAIRSMQGVDRGPTACLRSPCMELFFGRLARLYAAGRGRDRTGAYSCDVLPV